MRVQARRVDDAGVDQAHCLQVGLDAVADDDRTRAQHAALAELPDGVGAGAGDALELLGVDTRVPEDGGELVSSSSSSSSSSSK